MDNFLTMKLYSKNSDYFQYNGITTDNPVLDRFGLKDTSDDRWVKFWDKIDALNDDAGGKIFYKVIFLGRHGHATSNSQSPWIRADSGHWKDSDRPKRDSPLTQEGYLKARNVQTHWTTENSLDKGGIGIPQISYCSPLMRCLVTNTVSFTPQLAADGGPTINTVVYEDCREQVSTHESEHRRCKDCIAQMFSKFAIDPNFASNDPLWPEKESSDSVKARAKGVLERIFKVEPKDKRFVSITAHSGFISAFLSVIGFDHRTFHLVNACMSILEFMLRQQVW
ncbi:hypothetical protein BYT27DRAFT_7077738 [Phlegmacium glaucopus]|nr:hypothetical protein BYT27DRAFT_7077738 [Phlegmacium glaucopus]